MILNSVCFKCTIQQGQGQLLQIIPEGVTLMLQLRVTSLVWELRILLRKIPKGAMVFIWILALFIPL